MALLPGTLAGYYAGLLTAKYAKFNSLKHEALRIVRRIEYFGDSDTTHIVKAEDLEEIQYVSSELLTLRHRVAGHQMFVISAEIIGLVELCKEKPTPAYRLDEGMAQWQRTIRLLRPGWNVFVPWGQI